MKKIIVASKENTINLNDIVVEDNPKIYVGVHHDYGTVSLITVLSYDRLEAGNPTYTSRIVDDSFTSGNCYGDNEGYSSMAECMEKTSNHIWYEFNNFAEFCKWYLDKS